MGEVDTWIGPLSDDAPKWLKDAKARHAAAIDEYQRSVAYVVDTSGQIEAANRAHAEQLIREGAVNRLELLEDAGLTTAEAKRVRYAMLPGTLEFDPPEGES